MVPVAKLRMTPNSHRGGETFHRWEMAQTDCPQHSYQKIPECRASRDSPDNPLTRESLLRSRVCFIGRYLGFQQF